MIKLMKSDTHVQVLGTNMSGPHWQVECDVD